jgi:hypothetical protein
LQKNPSAYFAPNETKLQGEKPRGALFILSVSNIMILTHLRLIRRTMRNLTTTFGIVLVLFCTAGCVAATPSVSGTTAFADSASATLPAERTLGGGGKQIGEFTVTLFSSPNPPIRGTNALQALVVDANSRPVKDATVSFDVDMTTMSHGKNVVTAKLGDNGRYAATLSFVMPGPWRVIVAVQRQGAPPVSDRFNFSVNMR